MTQRIVQDVEPGADLATRCQALGVTLLAVNREGRITSTHVGNRNMLERVVVRSPLFTRALQEQVARWANQPEPKPTPVWQGCWLVPLPLVQRRRRVGYHVVVIITADVVGSAPYHAWCDAGGLDAQATAQHLRRHAAASDADVERFAGVVAYMARDMATIDRQQNEIDHLSQQLGESYEELSLVYQLSARMTVTQDVGDFLQDAVHELQQVVGLRWIAMYVADDDPRLQSLRGQTIHSGVIASGGNGLAMVGRQLMHEFGGEGAAVIADAAELGIKPLRSMAQRLLIVPIIREGKPLAILFGADKIDGPDMSSVDSKLVTSAAQSMGIFLENSMLYEDMQDMFMGTLRSLIATIDAKDTYTCGHSERVALLSRELAAAAGLPPAQVERVYLSALVHDVGKIGVPEAVLCKPGSLTDEEFAMIKAHPEIGVRILSDIHQMHDLLPGVMHHHERWDGRGYPYRLAGEKIPLFGRIICLADSFDAMSSDRTYRCAMTLEEALVEIRACAGTQFDPELAKVFVTLNFQPYHALIGEHQRRESPLSQAMRRAM